MSDKFQLTEAMIGERENGLITRWPEVYINGQPFVREDTNAHSVQGVSPTQFVVLPMGHTGLQKGEFTVPKKARSTTASVSGGGDGSD